MLRARVSVPIVFAVAVLAAATLLQAASTERLAVGRAPSALLQRADSVATAGAQADLPVPLARLPRPATLRAHRAAPVLRHAVERRPRPARRVRPAHGASSGVLDTAHYLRSLNGSRYDRPRLYWLGAYDARRNAGGLHVVLLDVGGQGHGGVFLSTTRRFLSYPKLVADIDAYLDGYHSHQWWRAAVTIAVGTNNDLVTSLQSGRDWATQVINPLIRHATRYRDMAVIGADDIEPGFAAGVRATAHWVHGYLAATTAPLLDNGSADGCSAIVAFSRCGGGWSARDIAWFAGMAAPGRILVLPQIYNPTMAGQWAQISRTARLSHRPAPHIVGVLTENAACAGDPTCPTMDGRQAWLALRRRLRQNGATPANAPALVDLDVR